MKLLLTLFSLLCFVSSRCVHCNAQTLTDQPDAQRQSVRQILAMGGDWEAPTKTLLIGFIGDKFTDEKFALLAPLVDVKILYFQDVPAKDDALIHCTKLRNVWQLQVESCLFSGVGFRHFAGAKKLERLFIEDTPITDDGLASIAKLSNLKLLDISCFKTPTQITVDGLRELRRLTKLEELYITMPEATREMEDEIRRLLPHCKRVYLESWDGEQDDR